MIIDLIAAAVLVLSTVFGFKRGFAKTALRFFGFFAAFIIVMMFGSQFENAAAETDAGKYVKSKVYNVTYEQLYRAGEESSKNALEALNLPGFIKSEIEQEYDVNSSGFYDGVSTAVADKTFSIASKIVFLLILLAVFSAAGIIIPRVFSLPVLRQADRLLGLIFGAVNGVIRVYLLILILSAAVNLSGADRLKETADNSFVFQNVYENGAGIFK